MGLGPSNLVILRADEDIRRLEWSDIEERLDFFRQWDMEDVSAAIVKFRGLKHALEKNRPPVMGDDAADLLTRRTNWAEFFTICFQVDDDRNMKLEARKRAVWHPSCQNFAMLVDHDALEAYDDYILGDTVRPAFEEYDDDAHSNDEASEQDSDGVDEDEEEGANGAAVDQEAEPDEANENLGAQEEPGGYEEPGGQVATLGDGIEDESSEGNGESKEGVDGGAPGESIGDDELSVDSGSLPGGGPPKPGAEDENQGNGFQYQSGRFEEGEGAEDLRVETKELPEQFDPAKYSPIFFGFSTKSAADVREDEAAKEAKREKREVEIVRRLLQKRREEIESIREEQGERRAQRAKRMEKLKAAQAKATKARALELATAKKMMKPGEFRAFERMFKSDEAAAVQANEAELDELLAHNMGIYTSEELLMTKLIAAAVAAENSQSFDRPSGEKLEVDGRVDLGRCIQELDSSCKELEDAQQRLALSREENEEADGKAHDRSILIHMEQMVEHGERNVDQALKSVDEAEVVLSRAARRRAKEAKILPLYNPLASSIEDTDFSAPLIQVVVALVVACTDTFAEKLRVLAILFDLDNDQWLSQVELTAMLYHVSKVMQGIGYFKSEISEEEAESAVMRCLHDMSVTSKQMPSDGLTLFESKQYVKSLVSRSPYLSSLFGTNFKFGELSSYQRQATPCVKQFEMGLIALPDLKYHYARTAVHYRPLLSPDSKLIIHERALAIGADDPLKPDYSRFLPTKASRNVSNVVPLEHGHIANTSVFRHQVLTKAATKMQNYYRCLQARRQAEFQARKQSFLRARAVALDEARKSVEAEFEAKESLEGTAKMKWDSKLRLRQSKLAAAGTPAERSAVLAMFLDEAIVMKETQVRARFQEMAEQRGFADPLPPEDDKSEAEDLFKKLKLDKAFGGADKPEILDAELVTPRADDGVQQEAAETDAEAHARRAAEAIANKQSAVAQMGDPSSTTTLRRKNMLLGSYPHDLYLTGMTEEERKLRYQLAIPNPSNQELYERLRSLNPSFTQLKTEDFLRELPSKALIAMYVRNLAHSGDLQLDIAAHFRILRNSKEIAQIMQQVCDTDLEAGVITNTALRLKESQDGVLQSVEHFETDLGLRKAQQKVEKALRSNKGEPAAVMDELWESEGNELSKRNDAAQELESSMEKLARKLRSSKLAITELSKRRRYLKKYLQNLKGEHVDVEVTPDLRVDWMKRYAAAMSAPEESADESRAKYSELAAVGMEFLDAATRGAMTVVDELYLPLDKKTIQAVLETPVDGRCAEAGRGVKGIRYKYEAFNIRFKVWIDDHGIFNGSDENSAKAAGNDLRASLEYTKCHLGDVNIPLEATVDYHGFRVLCVAKLPIENFTFAENGDVRKAGEDLVSGTANRGETVVNGNRVVDNRLAEASRKLNLARHAVKGSKDILNKFLYASVDMRVFKESSSQFGAINFWRAFPGEDCTVTTHLEMAPRGQSIFWRSLRPELVKGNVISASRAEGLMKEISDRYPPSVNIGGEFLLDGDALSEENMQLFASLSNDAKQHIIDTRSLPSGPVKVALSPDANCMIEYGCPEWEPHIWAVRDATKKLINELIPEMAQAFAARDLEGKSANSGYGINLAADLHRQGINLRHMGLLRSYFWRQVVGKVNIATNSNILLAHEDLRGQVRRGDYVILLTESQSVRKMAGLENKQYRISMDLKDEHSVQRFTLTEEVTELSVNDVDLRVGKLQDEANSTEMRQVLLAEMIARTAKNILRLFLRITCQAMRTTSGRLHSFMVTELLNLMTGSHELSDDFWSEQLFHAIRSRYGRCAVEDVERSNIRKDCEASLIYIVNRLISMVGIRLTRNALAQFNEEPVAFKFTIADVESGCPALRVKHNISVLDFARANLLSNQSLERRSQAYDKLVTTDGATLYLKLNERRGSRVAFNRGTGGMPLCGAYGRGVRMESSGPIANDDINRAVMFDPQTATTGCRIDFKYSPEIAPMGDDESWCVECWCRCLGGESTQRVVVMCGRYALVASREDRWQLELYSRVADIAVEGPPVIYGEWVHLVASYDGTIARLWSNGELSASVEVRPMVIKEVDRKLVEYEETREALIVAEGKSRDLCKRQTEEQAAAFFRTKEGGERIKAAAATLCEHAEFKFKMDARAAEKGLKLLSKQDAKVMAKQDYREKLYLKNVSVVAEHHRRRMEEHVESLAVDEAEAKDRATKPMRIGAACTSKRSSGGRFHFHGELCHVAVYVRSKVLTTDKIRAHYISGMQQRSVQADRISSMASTLFQSALEFAPDDQVVLKMYANSLCQALVFDSANADAVRRNIRKVEEAISVFSEYQNADALAEVLRRLPNDYKYAQLACSAFDALMKLNPSYFTLSSYMTLKELSVVPSKFSLTVPGSPPIYMRVAADIYRMVLSEPVLSMIYGEEMLRWVSTVKCPEVVCGLVAQAEADGDKRFIDLHVFHPIQNIEDGDLESIADHRRLTLAFNLSQCTLITDDGIFQAARRCTSLQALTLDGCTELTDKSLAALKKCTPSLHMLSAQKCHLMTEKGFVSLFNTCTKIRVLNLNYCKQVSDSVLSTVAACCKHLELLHVSMCTSLSDAGLYQFAMEANPRPFKSLDLSYCRGLSDDSIEAVAKKLTHISYLNLRGLSRVTDLSAKAVTHNLWQLTDLDLEDLFLITDDCFFFDHENDGRRAADAQMLTNVIHLNLSECNGLTDRCIGGISTRCSKLRSFHAAGLSLLTSTGFELFIREPTALAPRGEFLHVLNFSYVPTLTDASLELVAGSCPLLETVNLAGCVLLSDQGIQSLAATCGHVKKLGLSHAKRITDACICSCADYLWLEDLDISGCSKITDDGIEVLCLEFAGLVRLDLSSCSKVTNSALDSILRHSQYMRWLKLANLPLLTEDCIASLQDKHKNLKIVLANRVNDDDGKPLERIELV